MKNAQFWYIDFFIAVSIFIFGVLMFMFYMNTTQNDRIDMQSFETSGKVSELLMSTGIPFNWTSTDFEVPGIIYSNEIDSIKLSNLYSIDYDLLRNKLGVNKQLILFMTPINVDVENDIVTTIASHGNCGINVVGTLNKKNRIIYSRNNNITLQDVDFSFDLTAKNLFLNNLSDANIVILKDAYITDFTTIEKKKIENFVLNGNTVILTGKVNDNIFEFNFNELNNNGMISSVYFNKSFNSNVTQDITVYSESLKNIDDKSTTAYRYLVNSNVSDYEVLATGPNGYAILKIKYGLGFVYYFPEVDDLNLFSEIRNIIDSRDIETCTITNNFNYKKIFQTVRIARLDNNFVKLVVRVAE